MKKLLVSTFLLLALFGTSGRANAQEAIFDWDVFSSEVTRFLNKASEDGFEGWKGDFVGNGPMGLFEAFSCTESFMGGSGVLYKNPLGGYEFVIVLQVEQPTTSEKPSAEMDENYRYFAEWLGTQGTAITTQKDEGYVGFSRIREGSSLNLEEALARKWAALGFAIVYETSYSAEQGDLFQNGLVLTITSGFIEGETAPATDEPTTDDSDDFDWLLYGDEEEEEE